MLILDHLECLTNFGELKKFRMHNVSSPDNSGSSAAYGLLQYATSNNSLYLHVGSNVWKRLLMSGDALDAASGVTLGNNKIWRGNASNVPIETAVTSIPFTAFGDADRNVSMSNCKITSLLDPENPLDAANKKYVDQVAQGLSVKASCQLATNQALPACSYNAGALTLTANANGALTNTAIDSGGSGVTLVAGTTRVLVKTQATSEQNGIYLLTTIGTAGTPWVLTRTDDSNTNAELVSAFTLVEGGSAANFGYVQSSKDFDITNITTKSITWQLFSSAASYVGGNGMILSGGNTFHFAKTTAYVTGDLFYGNAAGSGDAAVSKVSVLGIGASGKMLQSNGSIPTWSTATFPTAAAAANAFLKGDGTNWVSMATVASRVMVTDGSGNSSWGTALPSGTTLNGATIYVANGTDVALGDGGTGSSLTAIEGGLVYSTGTGMAITSAGTAGYFVRSAGGGVGAVPTFYDLFGATNTWTGQNTFSRAVSSNVAISAKTIGDAFNRVELYANNTLYFGTGSSAPAVGFRCLESSVAVSLIGGDLYVKAAGGASREVRFYAADDTKYVGIGAPTSIAGLSISWRLPSSYVNNGVWISDGSGNLSCTTLSAALVGSGAALTANTDGSNVTLTAGGSASTALLAAASLTVGWSGQLNVARGGTGALSFTSNCLLYGNGTGALQTVSAGTTGTVLIGTTGSAPSFSGQPSLTTGIITNGQIAVQLNPFGVAAGNTGEIRFHELVANGGNYVGFKAPDSVTANKVWVLPSSDGTDNTYFMRTDGSGNLSFGRVTAAAIASGAALTASNDTNVTLTLGGAGVAASLLSAVSLTMGWTGNLSVARGGTGQGSSLTQYGMIYASSATTMASTAAPTIAGAPLLGSTSGAPSWSGYSLPSTVAGANYLFVSSSSSAFTTLGPTASRLLATDASGVISWGGILNVARNTAGGIARKWSNQVVGDGANAYITVTHNLNSKDVIVSVRLSNSTDSGQQEIAYSKFTVEDANSVRVYFNTVQLSTNYYVVTVVG